MGMIDIDNLSKLPPELKAQFEEVLKAHPHLESKMKSSYELNTETRQQETRPGERLSYSSMPPPPPPSDPDEIDYAALEPDRTQVLPSQRPDVRPPSMGQMKIDPNASFLQRSVEDQKTEQKAREEQIKEEKQKLAEKFTQPEELKNFSPEGKVHPLLKKLRATMGMKSKEKTHPIDIGGIVYELLPLMKEGSTKANALAALTSMNDEEFAENQDLAIIAFSVQTLDGVPLKEIFGVATEEVDEESKKRTPIPEWKREDMGAYAFYDELKSSPGELSNLLIQFYAQEFPRMDLLGPERTVAYCGTKGCDYSRIVSAKDGTEAFCPSHGTKLVPEAALPNPF